MPGAGWVVADGVGRRCPGAAPAPELPSAALTVTSPRTVGHSPNPWPGPAAAGTPARECCWCSPKPPCSKSRNTSENVSYQATARQNRDERRSHSHDPAAAAAGAPPQEQCQTQTTLQQDQDRHQHQKPQARYVFLINHSQAQRPQFTCVWGVPACLTLPDVPGAWPAHPPASEHSPDISYCVGVPWHCPRQGCAPLPGASSCISITWHCPCQGHAPCPGPG